MLCYARAGWESRFLSFFGGSERGIYLILTHYDAMDGWILHCGVGYGRVVCSRFNIYFYYSGSLHGCSVLFALLRCFGRFGGSK